jgi:hypothetical protein
MLESQRDNATAHPYDSGDARSRDGPILRRAFHVTQGAPIVDGIAIPGVLLRFLERASIAYAGTRDRGLVPHFHWVAGWRTERDPGRLSFFVAPPFEARLLQDVTQCPRIALTIESIGPHETYQFKGSFAGSRKPASADHAAFEQCRGRFVRDVTAIEKRFNFTARTLERYVGDAALVVTLEVQEIFLQTPGPGAGRRLVPPEAR